MSVFNELTNIAIQEFWIGGWIVLSISFLLCVYLIIAARKIHPPESENLGNGEIITPSNLLSELGATVINQPEVGFELDGSDSWFEGLSEVFSIFG